MGTSYISITDQFCGAGGSSLGAAAAGAEIELALNHWDLAIKTHNSNFPNTRHECTDISACEPRRYPHTTGLITSPECTNHTLAKGQKKYQRGAIGMHDMFEGYGLDPSSERSRATMWDVCRFAEAHTYEFIIVENVVEARQWRMWDSWWHAMTVSLGYKGECVYLNSQFAHPTPQSRDRLYVVFWRPGNRAPNLNITPEAWCVPCARNVFGVQSWKQPTKRWGRYNRQYVYCCPTCANIVRPYYYCAANAIDWSIPAPRIGDRRQPLKPKTIERIKAGLAKFSGQGSMLVMTNQGEAHRNLRHVLEPVQTQTTAVPPCLVTLPLPLIVPLDQSGGNGDRVRPVTEPWPTQTTAQAFGWLVPFAGPPADHPARPVSELWPTQTGYLNVGLLVETKYSHAMNDRTRQATEPWPAQTSQQSQALLTLPFLIRFSGKAGEPNGTIGLTDPLDTQVAAGSQHAMVMPPSYLVQLNNNGGARELTDPLTTVVASGNHHGLVHPPPFLVNYNGNGRAHPIDEALGAVTSIDRHAVVQPEYELRVEDCGFRILVSKEVGRAMAFREDYIVLGTAREQVKQYGNAVTPPAMELLTTRCIESLEGRAA